MEKVWDQMFYTKIRIMRGRNILFYFRFPFSPTAGGVERVSCVLGNWFSTHGFNVYYLSDFFLSEGESIFVHDKVGLNNNANFEALKKFVCEKSIEIIINQGAFFPTTKRLYELSCEGVKIISVVHNSLEAMYSHPSLPIKIPWAQSIMNTKFFASLFRLYFYCKYHGFLKYMVKQSDKVVVLSKCYIKEIEKFACKSDNVVAIGNPVTLDLEQDTWKKEKAVCFLGRLSWQKRPDLLLKMWSRMQNRDNWHLYMVGDGEMRPVLERMIEKEGLNNVSLEGYQDPKPYLRKSQIMCMTSVYEGFPLVLFEGMGYGLVPIAYDSFGSAKDIIEDGINGYLVSGFDTASYIARVSHLMNNPESWNVMSSAAKRTANDNTVDIIGEKWIELFKSLFN